MTALEKTLKFLTLEIDNVEAEVDEICDNKTVKASVYEDLLSEVEALAVKHSETTQKYIDTFAPGDDVTVKCRVINETTKRLRKASRKLKQNKPDDDSNGKKVQNTTASSAAESGKVKMPQLPLPTFSGDILKFQSFWDQYRCAVHDSEKLPPVQKFVYLRESLKEGALAAIEGYEITAANYPVVIERLKQRFGIPRLVVFALIKDLIMMNLVGSTTKALRDFHDLLVSRIRSLEALKFDVTDRNLNMLLVPILQMKLRPDLLEEWEREIADKDDDNITVDFYFTYIEKQISAKEAMERSAKPQEETDSSYGYDLPLSSTAALVSIPQSGTQSLQYPPRQQQLNTRYTQEEGPSQSLVGMGNPQNTRPPHAGRQPLLDSRLSRPGNPRMPASSYPNPRQARAPNPCAFCTYQHDTGDCQQLRNLHINDRWRWATEARLCFNCLLPTNANHNASSCRKQACPSDRCGRKHHRLLHYSDTRAYSCQGRRGGQNYQSLLQSGLAIIETNGTKMVVRLLFDTGSERSYIRKGIAEALRLEQVGPAESLTVTTLGAKSTTQTMRNVKLELVSRYDSTKRVNVRALAMDKICAPLDPLSVDNLPHLQSLQLADNYPRGRTTVDILLGQDHYYDVIHGGRCRRGPPGSPIALDSIFGWVLCGNVNIATPTVTAALTSSVREENKPESLQVISNQELHASLTRFWELESIGVSAETTEKSTNSEDEMVMKFFKDTTTFDGRNYTVRIPRKPEFDLRRNNYGAAYKCLQSVEKQLLRNTKKKEDYLLAMQKYETDGFADPVPREELNPRNPLVNYLPHHAVYKRDKETPRIVMNAAHSSSDGRSINDMIYQGPSLQPNLAGVLIRFRTHRVGLTADIRQMFLQIKLHPEDHDLHRYLWRDMNISEPPRTLRMNRVTFGVNCSPFLAIATVQQHARTQSSIFPDAAFELLWNMYVDDVATGSNSPARAKALVNELRSVLASGGFHLTKWASNSRAVMNSIPEEERHPAIATSRNTAGVVKTLGLTWNLETDTLSPDISGILRAVDKQTMRSATSQIAKLYDPLGWYGPFNVSAKILLQSMWLQHTKWDQTLTEECQQRWKKWKKQVASLAEFGVPRCMMIEEHTQTTAVELHGFSDASPQAYGAAVYARMTYEDGRRNSCLIMSRNRITPLKRVSLPRLELLGALICARLMTFVRESYIQTPVDSVCLWTDSLVTYYWLQKPPQTLKLFVGSRVEQATAEWPPATWRFCPGESNPSDLLTRGIDADDMKKSEKWWQGPAWLAKPETEWPSLPSIPSEPAEARPEMKLQTNALMTQLPDAEKAGNEQLQTTPYGTDIDPTRYSRYNKLLRITAYVFTARDNFKQRRQKNQPIVLTPEELRVAETYWINKAQNRHFKKTFDRLRNPSEKKQDNLLALDPYIDTKTQVLRVGGRLQNSKVPESTKHQIILPERDWVTRLIIEHTHHEASHVGIENTRCLVRQKFWVVHGRQEVKRVLRECRVCARVPTKAEGQKMGPLPKERVTPSPAFSTVGVDFAGPLYLRRDTKKNRTAEKSYICLFTCTTSRMIHLELCANMSTPEFIQAFRRMTNRRGLCHTVYSDNALTFKSSDRILKPRQAPDPQPKLKAEELREHFNKEGITWKFITERSPWQGGFYERMVRSVKHSLRRVLGQALLTYREMNTVLTDVEASVNSRPLTIISTDARDPEPLTPAHLAIGRPLRTLPDNSAADTFPPEASKRYVYMQRVMESLWRRWTLEYLPLLTIRKKWTVEKPAAKVGNVVLLSDDKTPRGQWPMAVITEVHPGKDGLIRNVTVKTTRNRYLTRPVQRLYLVEEVANAQQG